VTHRIYYDDGTTHDGLEDAPGLGVIVVAQADEDVGKELLHRKDFYYYERDRWFGCDIFGLLDYLQRPGMKKVLQGRNTEHRNYHALYERARTDPDLPYKTARLTGEVACV
jgi:hypothetical protein